MALYASMAVQLVVMLLLPLLLAWRVRRRLDGSWALIGAGALAFIGSQVVHIPMLFAISLIVQALGPVPDAWRLPLDCAVGGLAAGLCEEWARWVVIAKWRKEARDAPSAVLLGLGHGGVEAMIFGALAGMTILNMFVLRGSDPAAFGVPPDQVEAVRTQVSEFWGSPWYYPLLAAVERLMAMTLHVANNLLVMLAVVRGQHRWVWIAVLWHAIGNALTLAVARTVGPAAGEGALAVFTVGSVAISIATYRALSRALPSAP